MADQNDALIDYGDYCPQKVRDLLPASRKFFSDPYRELPSFTKPPPRSGSDLMMSRLWEEGKILFVRLSAFGDIIHTLPALCATRRRFPRAQIHWLVSRKYREILQGHPDIDRMHVLEPSIRGFLEMGRELRRERFEAAVDFQGLLKSAVLTWCSGAPRRLGRARRACRERGAACFYNERIQPQEEHVIKQNLELVQSLGVTDLARSYGLALPDLEPPPIFLERPVALNVGGGWPTKRYAPEKWGEVAREITEQWRRPVVVFWGPGEEGDAAVVRKIAPGAEIAPPTTYREMGRLLTRCALLVSSESGPLHLAVAVGTPAIGLMGVTDPRRNGPLDDKSRVVLPPPPHHWTYRRRGDNPTDRIPVAAVLKQVRELLAGEQDGPSSPSPTDSDRSFPKAGMKPHVDP